MTKSFYIAEGKVKRVSAHLTQKTAHHYLNTQVTTTMICIQKHRNGHKTTF